MLKARRAKNRLGVQTVPGTQALQPTISIDKLSSQGIESDEAYVSFAQKKDVGKNNGHGPSNQMKQNMIIEEDGEQQDNKSD